MIFGFPTLTHLLFITNQISAVLRRRLPIILLRSLHELFPDTCFQKDSERNFRFLKSYQNFRYEFGYLVNWFWRLWKPELISNWEGLANSFDVGPIISCTWKKMHIVLIFGVCGNDLEPEISKDSYLLTVILFSINKNDCLTWQVREE